MIYNPTVKKVMQVSEEAAPVVQIPIMVGNEMFVLIQQDIRRIEDTRHVSYTRYSPNGQIFPYAQTFGGGFLPAQSQDCPDVEMHDLQKTPHRIVANVANQLRWSKINNSTSPYPISYSVATSTTEIQILKKEQRRSGGEKQKSSCACNTTETKAQTTSQACNTEPIKTQASTDEDSCACSLCQKGSTDQKAANAV
ncbi:uncharacterized protein LOC6563748 [Drosophila grimshawi]|uniref:GH19541 n=1 Tax=Drosophila grimshawi TaxID=7222 RepID=B4JHB5_DROGR|nr:uncharacterized protein LOC6563748 [Drosophila grimshawi]EDV93822.1 GH19541 [Drosophila grimshawi]